MRIGIIIVDHGSRRAESNRMLEELAGLFAERFRLYMKYADIIIPCSRLNQDEVCRKIMEAIPSIA